jgi:hypothetical protein
MPIARDCRWMLSVSIWRAKTATEQGSILKTQSGSVTSMPSIDARKSRRTCQRATRAEQMELTELQCFELVGESESNGIVAGATNCV